MKALRILCGLAILLNALHLGHAIHHAFSLFPDHNAGFWGAFVAAVAIAILSFIGGCLLLREARTS